MSVTMGISRTLFIFCFILSFFNIYAAQDLTLYVNEDTNLKAVYNKKENSAIIIDYNEETISYMCGKGDIIIASINSKTGFSVESGFWDSLKCSFEEYFNSQSELSCDKVSKMTSAKAFDEDNIDDTTLGKLYNGLICFFNNFDEYFPDGSNKKVFDFFLDIGKKQLKFFKGTIIGAFECDRVGSYDLYSDFEYFEWILQGLADIMSKVDGKFTTLNKNGIKIDYKKLFQTKYGLPALNVFLEGCSSTNFGTLFSDYLSDPAFVLRTAIELGGSVVSCKNGLVNFLYKIVGYTQGTFDVFKVTYRLIEYTATSEVDLDCIQNDIEEFGSIIKDQLNEYGSNDELIGGLTLYNNLTSSRTVDYMKFLATISTTNGCKFIIETLMQLDEARIIPITESFPALVYSYLEILETSIAPKILLKYIPPTGVERHECGRINMIKTIKNNLDCDKMDSAHTLCEKLELLPIIGKLLDDFDEDLKADSQHSVKSLLKDIEEKSAGAKITKWLKDNLDI